MSSTNELEMFFALEKQVIDNHMIYAEPLPDQLANNFIEKYVDDVKEKIMSPFRTAKNYIYIIVLWTGITLIILACTYCCCKTRGCGIDRCCSFTWKKCKDRRLNKKNKKTTSKSLAVSTPSTSSALNNRPVVLQLKPLLEQESSKDVEITSLDLKLQSLL